MPEFIEEPIQYAVLIRAPRERVYDTLTTADGLDGWFTQGASIHAQPGGHIHLRWKDWGPDHYAGEEQGPVLEARRPERFVFEWHPGASYATKVEFDFEETKAGTVVRLREQGYPDTPAGRRQLLSCASGWGEALALWKFYVEHGLRY